MQNSGHVAGPVSSVITHTINVERVARRIRVYLEKTGAALIFTDIDGKPLNA
jgi:hypothetical protein